MTTQWCFSVRQELIGFGKRGSPEEGQRTEHSIPVEKGRLFLGQCIINPAGNEERKCSSSKPQNFLVAVDVYRFASGLGPNSTSPFNALRLACSCRFSSTHSFLSKMRKMHC